MKLPALPKKVTQSDGKGAQATASDVNSKSIKTVDDSLTEEELLTHHWAVDDIFTFENLGFSKNVNDLKYLICAACEFGPIGVHKLSNKKSYVSLDRITYRKE